MHFIRFLYSDPQSTRSWRITWPLGSISFIKKFNHVIMKSWSWSLGKANHSIYSTWKTKEAFGFSLGFDRCLFLCLLACDTNFLENGGLKKGNYIEVDQWTKGIRNKRVARISHLPWGGGNTCAGKKAQKSPDLPSSMLAIHTLPSLPSLATNSLPSLKSR